MSKFRASIKSIGDWDGLEREAVACWNRYIAHELERCDERLADETGAEGDTYGYVAQHAWELFSGTSDDETFDELGERVAAWIRAQ